MRLLLDFNVSRSAYEFLISAGADVDWVREWPEDPGDQAIFEKATTDRRIVVTLDKDFGELAVRSGVSSRGIVRLSDIATQSQGRLALLAVQTYTDALDSGAVVTVAPGRIRVRDANP